MSELTYIDWYSRFGTWTFRGDKYLRDICLEGDSMSEQITLELGERLRWLGWIIRHADIVPALLGLWNEWQTAEGWEARAEVLKALIDLLKGALADAPFGTAPVVGGDIQALCDCEEQALAIKLGDGTLLKTLLENLPGILAFIRAMLELFGAK